jgi:putative ABC transport system substrate-binding protein
LGETGYVEGQNVTIDYRWIEGHSERLSSIVSDLISRRVGVIATTGDTAQALAAKAATQTVPIVFRIGTDPVATGIVPSLNRPGGNITGATSLGQPLAAKRLQLMRELSPGLLWLCSSTRPMPVPRLRRKQYKKRRSFLVCA